MTTRTSAELGSLVALLRLVSPAIPIGSFAYSRGLEHAVVSGLVQDEASARTWIVGLLQGSLSHLDGPVLARIHNALASDDLPRATLWAEQLRASRESRELLLEDEQTGRALLRLLTDLDVPHAQALQAAGAHCLASGFALAAMHHGIAIEDLLVGYFYAACESQVSAALRLGTLGQTAGQRILSSVLVEIPSCVAQALILQDDEIGSLAPGLALTSAWHETQYSRLFRS